MTDSERLVIPKLPKTVLCIPDLQAPFHHPKAMDFLKMVADRHQPEAIIGIGDELDFQFLSRYDKFPEIDEPERELERGLCFLEELWAEFPAGMALTSNHIHGRLQSARKAGRLPPQMLVPWHQLTNAPKQWSWHEEVHLGSILFRHGDLWKKITKSQLSIDIPRNYGKHMSVVHGHLHSEHGTVASVLVGDEEYWGAYTGCLIDPRSKAFCYMKAPQIRLGALVISYGTPHRIPFRRGADGKWLRRL